MLALFKRDLFDVRSFYNVLVPLDGTPFLWKSIWRDKAPTRVVFFAWLTALGKISTTNNLRKRHIIVVDWCCMCKRYKESMDHLFLHYEIPSAILSCVGLTWGMPRRVVDPFSLVGEG